MREQIDKKYIKGVNHGYLLTKYRSDLLNQILVTANKDIYIDGLIDGKKSFELTQSRSRLKEIENLRSNKNLDLEK